MPAIWHIYHVNNCRHATPPKDKLVIIVCVSVKYMGLFINKAIHPFIKKNPDLLACQVVIKASDHKCLSYDSYVNCTRLFPFEADELSNVKDAVNSQTKTEIKTAVALSTTIEKCYKKII
ncbi:MAG: hypothetical protein NTZ34_03570 [Chloroflexi bacterium]|nr:hypothetical protein [Chloroflexota bacterium]